MTFVPVGPVISRSPVRWKKVIGVVVGKVGRSVEPGGASARQRIAIGQGAGRVGGAVGAVGAAGDEQNVAAGRRA